MYIENLGLVEMVSKRGKRKIEYIGKIFYWYVKVNEKGNLRIHIISEDKKINLEYPPLDSEVPVTQSYIRDTGVLLG